MVVVAIKRMVRKFSSSAEEEWPRHQEDAAKPPLEGADEVVLVKKIILLANTTPSARAVELRSIS